MAKNSNASLTDTNNYAAHLLMSGKKEELKKYDNYLKEHQAKLRRLQRELRGELVPGDYDGGY